MTVWMNPNAPILFFDSGVGGLSVLAPTRALLPNARIVYAADKLAGEAVTVDAVKAAPLPIFEGPAGERIDTVVLACTHFPLLADELGAVFPQVTYVDGGPGIARRIAYLTRGQPWPEEPSEGIMVFTSAVRLPSPASLESFGMGEVQFI